MKYFGYPSLFVISIAVPLFNIATKPKQTKPVSCVSVTFINEYNKPIRIWKTMSRISFKGFTVPGKIYKLKTMVENQNKPVVYHAEALGGDSIRLLLEGQESLSILPFDCDEKFINVTVTPAAFKQASACLRSQGGNSDGVCCHFPFIYKGVSHKTCINLDREALWCATTNNFDHEGKWGFC